MKTIIYYIALIIIVSCNRKLHIEKTETKSSDTHVVNTDSIVQVNKSLSQAYEELLRTTNSIGVVFENTPCDSAKIGGSGMPHIVNKITVAPDGTKTFEGTIKSYKDDAAAYQRAIFSLHGTIDSLAQLVKKDSSGHQASKSTEEKKVKTSSTPILLWVCFIFMAVMWLNERFRICPIPFINRQK